MKPDAELLTGYATQQDEAAFAELVRRHLDHVYSRSEMLSVSRQAELAQQLLDGTLVFHLGEGISVRGVVVDGSGQPIVNADVHVGHLGDSRSRDAQTGSDGSFRVSGCQPGEGIISAGADGRWRCATALERYRRLLAELHRRRIPPCA